MVPVLTSFLPPANVHLYLPACFKIWKAFNSGSLDDRFIEMCGELSEEHVSAPIASEVEDGGTVWKDVGIWSQTQWNILVDKGLLSMGMSSVIFFFASSR
jgi:proteasome activator subunit 4